MFLMNSPIYMKHIVRFSISERNTQFRNLKPKDSFPMNIKKIKEYFKNLNTLLKSI